jgi:hypothetical protein
VNGRWRRHPFRRVSPSYRVIFSGGGRRYAVGRYSYTFFADMESKGGTGVLQDAIRTLYEGFQFMVPPDVGYFDAYVRLIALPEV